MFKTVPEHLPLYPEPVSIRVQDVGATVGAAGLGKQSEDVPGVYVSEQFGTCSRTYRMGCRVCCVLGAGRPAAAAAALRSGIGLAGTAASLTTPIVVR